MATNENEQAENFRQWAKQFCGLETPRLVGRILRHDDDQALFEILQNPCVHRIVAGFRFPFDLSSVRLWLGERMERMASGKGMYVGARYRGTDCLLGYFGVKWDLGAANIGGAVDPLYWGKGLTEEMMFAMINELFGAGIGRIIATCALDNYSTMRVMRACNFDELERTEIDTPQGRRASRHFELTPERWRSARVMPAEIPLSPEDIQERRQALRTCRHHSPTNRQIRSRDRPHCREYSLHDCRDARCSHRRAV
jgi:RimJ/RimL family protein N-acetyltransferase